MQKKTLVCNIEQEVDEFSSKIPYKLINLQLNDFFSQFREYFQNIRVGDLGCGSAFPRKILTAPDYNCVYTGIDNSSQGCGHFEKDEDIIWDIAQGPRDKEMIFDAVLWFQPSEFRHLNIVRDYIKESGLLVFESGEYMFDKWDAEAAISRYFSVLEKIKYSISAVKSGELVYSIDDIFLIGRKL